ncbi:MAG: hypothetical protein ABFC94_08110 [Syntrophomonas sp.]
MIKRVKLHPNIKIVFGIAFLTVFAILSTKLGNYIDYQINASLQSTGK